MNKKTLFFCLVSFTIMITGCTIMPKQELSQYRNAFAQVQTSSEEILIDFAEAKQKAEKKLEAADKKKDNEKKIKPFTGKLDEAPDLPDAIAVRRNAFRTIDNFNNALVTLAEGKSVETLQTATSGFVDAAGKFITTATGEAVPGLSSVIGILKPVVAEFEKARLKEEFKKALVKGAPVIDQMLDEICKERKDHFTLRADEANLKYIEIVKNINRSAKSVLTLFKQYKGSSTVTDPMPAIQKQLNIALAPAQHAFNKYPVTLSYSPATNDKFGPEQEIIAKQAIAKIKDHVSDYQLNHEQYNRLKYALESYGDMLKATRKALKELVAALDKPQDLNTSIEDLFEIAFTVKRELEAFKAARSNIN